MESALPEEQEQPRRRGDSILKHLGKHQLVSVFTTLVDYATMIVLVSGFGLGPVAGTVVGAAVGAITNFALGRWFTYRAQQQPVQGQAIRYAAVALMSLAWNGLGEHLLAVVLGMQYIVARVIVGILVSLVWNFPLQRYFVFKP
jgi:putative flippase GtrA